MDMRKVHPDLENIATAGGLFDVKPCELDLNVGRFGRVANPNKPGFGTIHRERFQIVSLQKYYRGERIYRVVFESDVNRFGSPLSPEDAILELEQTMTKDQLRQIFRTMEPNRAQEIREAYHKAVEGLMALARELGQMQTWPIHQRHFWTNI